MSNIICNPNFLYKYTLDKIENDLFEINNAFDVYYLQKDKNKIYLCGSDELKRTYLQIYEFIDEEFKQKLTLTNHKDFIFSCKYFLNKKTKEEYLISMDKGITSINSIIWTIIDENNYQEILNCNHNDNIRFPFSLIFNNETKKKFYFIYPSSQVDSEIITENKNIFKRINFTEGQILHYYIWENDKKNKNHVIQCNRDYVYIYDIFQNQLIFTKIESEKIHGNNFSCCILYNKNNTDILCIVNEQGNIVFYNLMENKIIFIININDNSLVQVDIFNDNYLIVLSKNGFYMILDYYNRKIVSKNFSNILTKVKTIKIFNHEIYGKYILLGGFMKGISIYKNLPNILISKNKFL